MKKLLLILICTHFIVEPSHGIEKTIHMPNLERPEIIVLNNDFIVVQDNVSIKLFDRKNYKFIKMIGREGQGPGEFQTFANPQILPEYILVSSTRKITYFSFTGELIKEKKHDLLGTYIKNIKDKYVGNVIVKNEPDDFYMAYNLYDSNFRKLKELHRGKWWLHKNKRRDYFQIFFYDTYEDKIVVAHREGFIVDILDSNGNVIHSIKHNAIPVPFTKEDRERVLTYWRERGYDQWQIEDLKKRTDFPKNYPPIQTCLLADGSIYVITYRKKMDQYECLIYDMNGKYVKRIYLPIIMSAPNLASPFSINDGNLYQLIYDHEHNLWKLHVNRIDYDICLLIIR